MSQLSAAGAVLHGMGCKTGSRDIPALSVSEVVCMECPKSFTQLWVLGFGVPQAEP